MECQKPSGMYSVCTTDSPTRPSVLSDRSPPPGDHEGYPHRGPLPSPFPLPTTNLHRVLLPPRQRCLSTRGLSTLSPVHAKVRLERNPIVDARGRASDREVHAK